MKTRPLGRTGLDVSEICLGTMTWGSQNSEAEGHAQMDYAVAHGVNFFDTAEMYPTTPLAKETVGRTEEIVGSWLKASGKRQDIIVATKIIGAGNDKVRDGGPITPESLKIAVDGSLARLQTDVIDLYQLHWPNRGSYHFRKSWTYDPSGQDPVAIRENMQAVLETLADLIAAGKIRHVGLSNETAWGTAQFLELSRAHGLPRMASLQNEYSLMHRIYDLDLAELSLNEDVGLLAYSPLAAGLLTGKYAEGAKPEGSRATINTDLGGRFTPSALAVADEYTAIARRHGLDPSQMALAFCLTRPFMASVIIGATTMDQLATDIGAADLALGAEVMEEIAAVYRRYPLPL